MVLALVALLALAGCRNMEEQAKLDDPYQSSPNFDRAARDILPEAVPVGFERDDEHFSFGTIDGELADTLPFELTAEILATGQMRYEQFCMPCHGLDGSGEGIVALEGYPQPASYHTDELRAQPVGHIYQVITNGQGEMFSYAGRITAEDRWAVTAYVKALQLSQNVAAADLSEDALNALNAPAEPEMEDEPAMAEVTSEETPEATSEATPEVASEATPDAEMVPETTEEPEGTAP